MKVNGLLVALICATACSRDGQGARTDLPLSPDDSTTGESAHERVSTVGPLTLRVTDTASIGGVFWALPFVTAETATVLVQNTRYGSLCGLDVSGNAAIGATDGAVTLRVVYRERLATCPPEIRALTYKARVVVPAGEHQLTVIHDQNGRVDTLVRRRVVVP